MRVVLATANAGKLAEFRALVARLPIELVAQSELGIEPAPEDATTFVENALAKARYASARSKLPALADDSGLVVAALGGEPGVRSARYAGAHGDDAANNRRLLERLGRATDRRAHFYCALAFLRAPDDPAPLIATGAWWGEIAEAPRGRGGFGYDPIFVPAGSVFTAAELEPDAKNRVSHRALAMQSWKAAIALDAALLRDAP
jgi:XTP/dITP diphosphohydrolase